ENGIPLSKQRRWLVIPGSVGQPRDGNPAACYATFDTETLELTYYRVPYDHETASAKILRAGLPAALASRLLTGN
ncbi:MAG: metallophosphoesterase, partial [Burkholderiaceae bacterium]|nr:metallophosphoesterase [Burkholderiaceae bacterium]